MSLPRSWTTSDNSTSYPDFGPHITLAALPDGSSDTVFRNRLREIVPKNLPSGIEVSFKSIETGNHYFRSVFIAIQLTSEISSLHTEIHRALNIQPRTPLFPHLSLCYIGGEEDSASREKQRWKENLEESGRVRTSASGGVQLNCGSVKEGEEEWISGFKAHEIWIVNCVGAVEEWQVLEKFPLSESSL
ncbi:hypothetical protein GYMLUDRAFT_216746 [Collybiopsis luxurians FD-317 M1]|nr:hypothetical protein GYMLUDRAFT_216746 [Collybiopsis luxurians FD-317 M1]